MLPDKPTHRRKCDLSPDEVNQIEQEIIHSCHRFVAEKHNVKISTVRGIARERNKRTGLSWWMHGADLEPLTTALRAYKEASE